MTTIAWDGQRLAGDRCAVNGDVASRVTKVHYLPEIDALVGGCGDLWRVYELIDHIRGIKKAERGDFDKAELLIVYRDRACTMEGSLREMPIEEKFFAIGSGAGMAMGALAAGASAARAVQIVAEHGCGSDHGFDIVQFPPSIPSTDGV